MKHKTNFETHTYDKNYIKQYQAILIQRMSSYLKDALTKTFVYLFILRSKTNQF